MVEFLKTITGKDFSYEKGKRYVSLNQQMNSNYEDIVLVRQPDSPKNRNWWTEFPKSSIGRDFKILDDEEMSLDERQKENKLLQL